MFVKWSFDWALSAKPGDLFSRWFPSNHRRSPAKHKAPECEDLWKLLLWFTELSSFGQGDEDRIVDVLVVSFLPLFQHLKHTRATRMSDAPEHPTTRKSTVKLPPDLHLLDVTMGASTELVSIWKSTLWDWTIQESHSELFQSVCRSKVQPLLVLSIFHCEGFLIFISYGLFLHCF